MKPKKVLNLRTHVGGFLGKTSYDSVKHEVEMELLDGGVLIRTVKNKPCNLFIPFANVVEVLLESDGEAAPAIDDVIKRGPGRPPGPKSVA